ncbi:hypothetical protein VMCG_10039 [Cytospora schulzeri]|uniref:Transcription factor domain-containing protein n=1 Tax=Cytospora schulzeri TaxID=448051 RepID=A0A423VI00_9PEZI|nr:hypothetical protein VMCG_10039 [Valsa malicola]
MNLYRPFVNFDIIRGGKKNHSGSHETNPSPRESSSSGYAPFTASCATTCISHTLSHTQLVHQVLSETDLLDGWHECFQWQWNATVTIVGFLLAHPLGPSTAAARRAAHCAVEAFELFGRNNVAVARSAASVTRDLVAKADLLVARLTGFGEPGLVGSHQKQQQQQAAVDGKSSLAETGEQQDLVQGHASGLLGHTSSPVDQHSLFQTFNGTTDFSGFMDLAMTVDAFNNFDDFLTETCSPAALWDMH